MKDMKQMKIKYTGTWINLTKNKSGEVQQISYDHTLTILNGQINVVFYDVTTLYFEIRAGR